MPIKKVSDNAFKEVLENSKPVVAKFEPAGVVFSPSFFWGRFEPLNNLLLSSKESQ